MEPSEKLLTAIRRSSSPAPIDIRLRASEAADSLCSLLAPVFGRGPSIEGPGRDVLVVGFVKITERPR